MMSINMKTGARGLRPTFTCQLAPVHKSAKFMMRGDGPPLPQDDVLAPRGGERQRERNVIGANTVACGQCFNHVSGAAATQGRDARRNDGGVNKVQVHAAPLTVINTELFAAKHRQSSTHRWAPAMISQARASARCSQARESLGLRLDSFTNTAKMGGG